MTIHLRPMRNSDSESVIALVRNCLDEYPGLVFDPDGDDADLLAPASSFWKADGQAWVAETENGVIAGCGGGIPGRQDRWEMRRLFVAPHARNKGLGTILLRFIETAALESGGQEMEYWVDSRFEDGHAFLIRHGYANTGETRENYDLSHTVEHRFVKPLRVQFQRLRRAARAGG